MALERSSLRLAMRVEGDWWVAYAAQVGTMDDAIRLGTVQMQVVADPARKQAFMDLMSSYLADVLAGIGAKVTAFETRPAPQHERAGRA